MPERFSFQRQQLYFQLLDDGVRNFILDGEDVGQVAIEALRPDVGAVGGGDQLGRDAHAGAGFAHAAFEQELDAEFLADVLHFHRATLVGERGVARDDG